MGPVWPRWAWASESGFPQFPCDATSVARSSLHHVPSKPSPDPPAPARLRPPRHFASSARRWTGGVRSVASTVSTGTTRRTVRAPRIAEFAAHRLSEGVNACRILRGASQRPSLDRRLPRPPADAEVRLSGSITMASVSLVNALRSRPARAIMVGMIRFTPLSHSERGTEQHR